MPACGADALAPEPSFAGAARRRSVGPVPRLAHRIAALAVAVAVAALPACGTSRDNDNARNLLVQEFTFVPSPFRATAEQKVTVVNLDSVRHTVTADDGSLATGSIKPRGRASFTVERPGDFAFHCEIHNYMRGVIQVAPVGTSA
jgi:plastocyanin